MDRRNTLGKSFCRCFVLQGFSWPLVEPTLTDAALPTSGRKAQKAALRGGFSRQALSYGRDADEREMST